MAEKSDNVYLATDPDREGEAISWHLAYILGLPDDYNKRVEFNEITKTGVTHGMENPRKINIDLVNAQQARRILDRLVGYKLSPFISQKIRRGLSAGRVQSVALKIIVDSRTGSYPQRTVRRCTSGSFPYGQYGGGRILLSA